MSHLLNISHKKGLQPLNPCQLKVSICLCLCVVYNGVLFDVADMDDIAMMLITDEQFNFGFVFSPTSSEQE